MAAHPRFILAEQADARLNAAIAAKAAGRTRWTMTAADERIPEIAEALRAKREADEAWLDEMRQASMRRSAAKAAR